MKRTSLFSIVVLGLFISSTWIGCCPPYEESKVLAVTLWPQETSQWCWAASGQMCMDFLGNNLSQCTQANNRFGRNDCCNSPTPNACVVGGWPEFNKYNFTSKNTIDAPLSWDKIRSEIDCNNRPITYTWHWPLKSGHMVTVIGYSVGKCSGERFLHINDPSPPNVGSKYTITYDAYVAGSPGSSHWNDYYEITPTP
jgi:hypothetical protein